MSGFLGELGLGEEQGVTGAGEVEGVGANFSGPAGDAAAVPPPRPPLSGPAPVGTGSSRPGPGPLKQRERSSSPGPDSLRRAETGLGRVCKEGREKKVETSPRPQGVTVFGGRESLLTEEKGTDEECTFRPRHPGQGAAGSPSPGPARPLPPSASRGARASRRLAPSVSGTHRVRGCPSSSIMVGATERSRDKGEGRAGEGRGRGGKGGGSGHRLGTEEKVPNPALGLSPPSPLRTLRSNQEEREEEEDEQNGHRHQPGRKREERRRGPPGHRSGQRRRPVKGITERGGGGIGR